MNTGEIKSTGYYQLKYVKQSSSSKFTDSEAFRQMQADAFKAQEKLALQHCKELSDLDMKL